MYYDDCVCEQKIKNAIFAYRSVSIVRAVPTRSCWLPMQQPTTQEEKEHARSLRNFSMLGNNTKLIKL